MERNCELCEGKAVIYCGADEAYICSECDGKVHNANFIVARHLRSILCYKCRAPAFLVTNRETCSATRATDTCPTCACLDDLHDQYSTADDSSSSTEASEDVGTSSSNRRKRRRSRSPSPDCVIYAARKNSSHNKETEKKLEIVLRSWSEQMGLGDLDRISSIAMQLVRRVAGSINDNQLDFRAAAACCLWIAIKMDCSHLLVPVPRMDKFEKCTGIPASALLALEGRLCLALKFLGF